MNFYCVQAEFYENGTVKAAIITKQYNTKPKNQCVTKYGVTAYRIWYVNLTNANQLLLDIRNGKADQEDVSWLFTEMAAA